MTTGSPRRSRSELRADILAAAAEEFGRRGLSGASLRAIAERAGTSHQLVGYHFGSKVDLWDETVAHLFEHLTWLGPDLRFETDADDAQPREIFRSHLRSVLKAAGRQSLVRLLAHEGLSGHQRAAAFVRTDVRDDSIDYFERAQLAGAVTDEVSAVELDTAFTGIVDIRTILERGSRRVLTDHDVDIDDAERLSDVVVTLFRP